MNEKTFFLYWDLPDMRTKSQCSSACILVKRLLYEYINILQDAKCYIPCPCLLLEIPLISIMHTARTRYPPSLGVQDARWNSAQNLPGVSVMIMEPTPCSRRSTVYCEDCYLLSDHYYIIHISTSPPLPHKNIYK